LEDITLGEDRGHDLLAKYGLELALLEDAYITSRYFVREFSESEVERVMRVVEEVMMYVKENDC